MSKPGFSYGLNLSKKPGASKSAPSKRKPIFGNDDDSEDESKPVQSQAEEIGEFDGLSTLPIESAPARKNKSKNGLPTQPPGAKPKKPDTIMFGDLSSTLTSRKNAEKAEEEDANIYDYDAVYDSLKPQKKETKEDVERRPKYMSGLLAAAAVRKRDALIAEEKKIAKDRAAEGDEFADKEKFVTEAYKKQQEENRRIEEEERKREEEEAKKNKSGGMTAFYKQMLNKGDERHAAVLKAAEDRLKAGPQEQEKEEEKVKTEADVAKEINAKGGDIAINEEGEVVDKRQLLRGGLNVAPKKKEELRKEPPRSSTKNANSSQGRGFVGAGGKQGMRERQSRMLEEQLEQSLKRSLAQEEDEKQKIERASKSRKTEGEISSAKERYLARKREAEEAKKKGLTE
jgi:coiled-coil domain-containing protein 55